MVTYSRPLENSDMVSSLIKTILSTKVSEGTVVTGWVGLGIGIEKLCSRLQEILYICENGYPHI
jgi:hypothetical protein